MPTSRLDNQTNQLQSKVSAPTPRTRNRNLVAPVTPTRRSTRRPPEDYKPYATPSNIAQLQLKQAKNNTSGIAHPHTPRAGVSSNPFEIDLCLTPLSISRAQDGQNDF